MHSWAAQALRRRRPTPVAMLHAGVLKKFGLYGLHPHRAAALPLGAHRRRSATRCSSMLVGNILVDRPRHHPSGCASTACSATPASCTWATSSSASPPAPSWRCSGAVVVMFAHGISHRAVHSRSAGGCANQLGTLEFSRADSATQRAVLDRRLRLRRPSPRSACPASPTSPAKSWLLHGHLRRQTVVAGKPARCRWTTTLLALGVVISAVYMLRAYRKFFRHCGMPVP